MKFRILAMACLSMILLITPTLSKEQAYKSDLDEQVKKFLEDHEYGWYDMNVPAVDGRKL